ncbi:M23 family metallopeptidase [Caldicellulosiruptor sp. F32]|uniref:M23 family metallopeptidase n=1 Tax=Caldicellulosiruptor sp. F32 TaxID=1214564 RepID=UPI0003A879F9|nr:M23 family metallopeptidase [Caldicellulosiruptor sp. F32]
MKRKKFTKDTSSSKNNLLVVKFFVVLAVIIFVVAFKYQYLKFENFNIEELKKYYTYDEKVYKYIKDFVRDFLKIKGATVNVYKDSSIKKEDSNTFLYPADGQIEFSQDGGYFIVVTKTTNIIAPCSGTVISIKNKAGRFDIAIQDEKNVFYILENLDILSAQKGKMVKKGEVIGQKKPFELSEKDFIYFKRKEAM